MDQVALLSNTKGNTVLKGSNSCCGWTGVLTNSIKLFQETKHPAIWIGDLFCSTVERNEKPSTSPMHTDDCEPTSKLYILPGWVVVMGEDGTLSVSAGGRRCYTLPLNYTMHWTKLASWFKADLWPPPPAKRAIKPHDQRPLSIVKYCLACYLHLHRAALLIN